MRENLKVLTIFGTRPEAVKLAPVIKKIEEFPNRFTSVVCVTAQHREMLDQVLDLFKITPSYDLDIMKPNQTLFDVTCNSLTRVSKILEKEWPDLVMVQGDTTTTFATALAAFYLKIPVGHVEAGLRSYNKFHPFPEEINRRLASHISDLHFAPTIAAKENLLKEGIDQSKIWVTGNTVIDALLMAAKHLESPETQAEWDEYFLSKWGISFNSRRIVLVTGHRRESFGEGFQNICTALKQIATTHKDIKLIYPVHLNPNVQEPVREILSDVGNIYLIDPLDYEPFVYLMSKSYIILTDSGGIQEEAPSLGKPVLVMRDVTERPEGVDADTSKLVGTDVERILFETERLLTDHDYYLEMSRAHNPYGDGKASDRIVEVLKEFQVRR
jgi:UDP-N-acetylglucosamine 2-epimerase (non-hydrolysing)